MKKHEAKKYLKKKYGITKYDTSILSALADISKDIKEPSEDIAKAIEAVSALMGK